MGHLRDAYQGSERRACRATGFVRTTQRYRSQRDPRTGLRMRLKDLAVARVRYGYRRLNVLLRREGWYVVHKKPYRLYREEHLTVKRRGGHKPALGTRRPMTIPEEANQRRLLYFVSDALIDSRHFRVLAVVDDFSRESLALVVDNPLSGVRAARELDRIATVRGYPQMIVSDNGTVLTSNPILGGPRERGVA